MVSRLERALLHRIKLNPLNLNLQNRREPSDRPILLGFGVLDADFLSIESPINGSIDIPRSTSNIDFDITPTFLLGSNANFSGNVGPSLTIE